MTDVRWLLDEVKAERNHQALELSEAHIRIAQLEKSEDSLKRRIEELEDELAKLTKFSTIPTTPLLLICGDAGFCEEDAGQLIRARVWYRTMENATRKMIEDELSRRRQNNDLYPWIHVSAHGSKDGILLTDGIAEASWWNRQLQGVKVVFAANCESAEVGDSLAGVVDFVVVFYGDRESEYMSEFAYTFWKEMMLTNDARTSYNKGLSTVPAIRPHVDLRVS